MRNKNFALGASLIVFFGMAAIICVGLLVLQLSTLAVFILSALWIAVMGFIKGFSAEEIENFFVMGIKTAAPVIAILIAVGLMIGTWIASGVIPTIIYYGLKLIRPSLFLLVTFLVCSISSVFVGSSYSCVATMGVAFLGIGYGLGISPGMTAGAAVSGAVFGDKMSPFSDTTNLAPALAGTTLFAHIRAMLWTTGPAFIISGMIYFFIGMKVIGNDTADLSQVTEITDALARNFNVHPVLLLLPIFTIVLAIMKVPPVTALVLGALAALLAGIALQGNHVTMSELVVSLASGYSGESGVAAVDTLLNRGGVNSMMSTVATTTFALCMGEMMQQLGILKSIVTAIEKFANSARRIVVSTLASTLLVNMITGSQYMSLVLPGELFSGVYRKAGIQPYVLSRTLEDGGTVLNFIIPWAAGAVYAGGVLGITPMEYIPWCFFPMFSPLVALVYGLTGFAIYRIPKEQMEVSSPEKAS